ncbi:hypothetical protein CEXT_576971 [Caerostris extrusa]|uniref:Uncharacterized protein n=1 Tax=Caerostris extrusa TaxID=172846 RepID=A0AAV4MRM5_CAEEX|nr:hypothetical protein CEXT_576971 [Caerostris extrusa]
MSKLESSKSNIKLVLVQTENSKNRQAIVSAKGIKCHFATYSQFALQIHRARILAHITSSTYEIKTHSAMSLREQVPIFTELRKSTASPYDCPLNENNVKEKGKFSSKQEWRDAMSLNTTHSAPVGEGGTTWQTSMAYGFQPSLLRVNPGQYTGERHAEFCNGVKPGTCRGAPAMLAHSERAEEIQGRQKVAIKLYN